jgi:hypothetical protein
MIGLPTTLMMPPLEIEDTVRDPTKTIYVGRRPGTHVLRRTV